MLRYLHFRRPNGELLAGRQFPDSMADGELLMIIAEAARPRAVARGRSVQKPKSTLNAGSWPILTALHSSDTSRRCPSVSPSMYPCVVSIER